MNDYLPFGEFKWENPEIFNSNKILNHPNNASKGYIFEVDLQYPEIYTNFIMMDKINFIQFPNSREIKPITVQTQLL